MLRPRVFLFAAFLLAAAGCAVKPRPAQIPRAGEELQAAHKTAYLVPVAGKARRVVSKSYTIGVRQKAAKGQPIVRVGDYMVADKVITAVALRPFEQNCRRPKVVAVLRDKRLRDRRKTRRNPKTNAKPASSKGGGENRLICRSGPLSHLRGSRDQRFDIAGAIKQGGATYYLLAAETAGGALYIAADPSGRLKADGYALWRGKEDTRVSTLGLPLEVLDLPVPLDTTVPLFRYETRESVLLAGSEHRHYELLYGGITHNHKGAVYHLLYREYGRHDTKVPIHTQDLAFSTDTRTIDVLGLGIRIYSVRDARLEYTVLRD